MYMKDNKTFKLMMEGEIVHFNQYELWSILTNQNELGINTIAIQKAYDGHFVCFVDALTVEAYKKEMREV